MEAQGYDLYMVEANHTKDELMQKIAEKTEAGEYCYELDVANNHLSKEQADDFIAANAGANSKYVYLHQHQSKKLKGVQDE